MRNRRLWLHQLRKVTLLTNVNPGTALARQRWDRTEYRRSRDRAEAIVAGWPVLTDDQQADILDILAPIVNGELSAAGAA